MTEFAWECECGNITYSQMQPEECEKCFEISSFTQLPEELMEERKKESEEDIIELAPTKSLKIKIKRTKIKKAKPYSVRRNKK